MSSFTNSDQHDKSTPPAKDAEVEFPALPSRKAKAPAKANAAAGGGNSNDAGNVAPVNDAQASVSDANVTVSSKKKKKDTSASAAAPADAVGADGADGAAAPTDVVGADGAAAPAEAEKEAKKADKADKAARKVDKAAKKADKEAAEKDANAAKKADKAAKKAAILAAAGSHDPAAAASAASAAPAPAADALAAAAPAAAAGGGGRSYKQAASTCSQVEVNPHLTKLAILARSEIDRLCQADAQEAEKNRKVAEKKLTEDANETLKQLLAKHKVSHTAASIALQQANAQLTVSPFTTADLATWRRLASNEKANEESRAAAEGILAAHGLHLLEIQRLARNLKEIEKTKPLSPQEQALRQKKTLAVQQKAESEAKAEKKTANVESFNKGFDEFLNSQKTKANGKPNTGYMFRKTCQRAMTGPGTSVPIICEHGMDPAILTQISATSGPTFTPIFRIDGGNVMRVPKWKGLFPPYNPSKASKDGTTLTESDYYERCVMVAIFKFWNHAKTVLSDKNKSREKLITMLQLLGNAANFSDSHKFKTRHEFVSEQAAMFREKQETAKQEASASAKCVASISSNSFAELAEETCNVPFARGGGCPAKAEAVSCTRGGNFADNDVSSERGNQLKTRGSSSQVTPVSEVRPKRGVTIPPTSEQTNKLHRSFAMIGENYGGLSIGPESWLNDKAVWNEQRVPIMATLSECGVKVSSSQDVIAYLKEHAFLGQDEISIKKSNSGLKTVLPVLDKDGKVVQKASKSVDSATGGA